MATHILLNHIIAGAAISREQALQTAMQGDLTSECNFPSLFEIIIAHNTEELGTAHLICIFCPTAKYENNAGNMKLCYWLV